MTSQAERRKRRRQNAEEARKIVPGARVEPASAIKAIEDEIEDRARRQQRPRRVDKPMIERLHASGAISAAQRRAFEVLERDFERSGLTCWSSCLDVRDGGGSGGPRTPGTGPGWSRYNAAMRAVGPVLSPVLQAVLAGEAPSEYAAKCGLPRTDGPATLRLACTALIEHYQAAKPKAA